MIHPWTRIGGPPEHREWIRDSSKPSFPVDIDPTAYVQPFVTVDRGTKTPTYVGPRVLLLTKCHVGHDAQIGADCELSPGVVICGHAIIGARTRIGVNASVLPGVRVGTDVVIGAGAVVVRDIPDGETWGGNPARNLHEPVEDARVFGRMVDYDYEEA